ncbi:transposase [Streptomyces triticiradicis]|uniref:Transposase n=1 Tax=Streptomyces triticiradicis TaxID=2651189 RepID=A0A7J5DNV2_9ACTN|nr:transposase [Streptomyces triticiradicis]
MAQAEVDRQDGGQRLPCVHDAPGPSTLIADTSTLDPESRRGVPVGTYKYPAEFRADAVELVRSAGRPVSQIAAELGVNHETLRQWVKTADKAARPEAVVESAKDAEIAALRKQVRELEMERAILRRAAKYFAGETSR